MSDTTMTTPSSKVTVTLELPNPERAWALAQLCKRLQWSQCREIAVNHAEAYEMIYATNELAQALAAAGFAPR